jgi:hypothetical protein
MSLDPGVYCVFSAPGSTVPAPDTGLPAVRISAAPGPIAGQVEVTSLDSQGWIGPEAATLLRVSGARSAVLVTVYQAKGTKAAAPQLQVVRVSGAAEAEAAAGNPAVAGQAALPQAPAPAQAARTPREVTVVAHIYSLGDVGGNIGEWIGEPGSKRWIEGFALAPAGIVPIDEVEYQAVLGRGWLSPWSPGGQFCGSRSMSLPILGLRVRLRGEAAKTHRIVLEATFIDGSTVGPVGDGEPCEAESLAALEAFRLAIEPVAATSAFAKGSAKGPAGKPAAKPAAKAKTATKPDAKSDAAGSVKASPAPVAQKPAQKPDPKPAPKGAQKPGAATKPAASTAKPGRAPARRR